MYTRQTYYQPSSITIAYDAHGTLGGASTWARGGNFSIGFASGAVASFMTTTADVLTQNLCEAWQVTCMVAAGTLSGGVTASMAGGNFWDWVCNGLICAGLNHAMHMACKAEEGPDDPPQQEPKQQNNGFKRLIGKKFFWELKNHYITGEGEDVFLTKEQFTELIIHGKIDYANAELGEDGYYTTSISFYETNDDLHYSFGTATVKYKVLDDNKIMYSGFKDTYNFDPKPWGVRSFKNEVITRTYNIISNGTDFSIYYNKTLF